MPEMEGTFLEILRRYLEREGINFSFEIDKITIPIEEPIESNGVRIIEKKELAFIENIENCEIWKIYYQQNPQINRKVLVIYCEYLAGIMVPLRIKYARSGYPSK